MILQIKPDAFLGQGTTVDLISHIGYGVSASLTVRIMHTITVPITTYAVYFNGKIWHESKDLQDAIAGWNTLVIKENLESLNKL